MLTLYVDHFTIFWSGKWNLYFHTVRVCFYLHFVFVSINYCQYSYTQNTHKNGRLKRLMRIEGPFELGRQGLGIALYQAVHLFVSFCAAAAGDSIVI
jgi:hypothetical protein